MLQVLQLSHDRGALATKLKRLLLRGHAPGYTRQPAVEGAMDSLSSAACHPCGRSRALGNPWVSRQGQELQGVSEHVIYGKEANLLWRMLSRW